MLGEEDRLNERDTNLVSTTLSKHCLVKPTGEQDAKVIISTVRIGTFLFLSILSIIEQPLDMTSIWRCDIFMIVRGHVYIILALAS